MADEGTKSVTWKVTIISTVMTLATSTAGYISSHWGGVTAEQLKATEDRITASVNKVEMKVASESTRLQNYVDEKVDGAEERLTPKAKKRKERRE